MCKAFHPWKEASRKKYTIIKDLGQRDSLKQICSFKFTYQIWNVSGKVRKSYLHIQALVYFHLCKKKKGGGEKVRKNTNFQLSHEIGLSSNFNIWMQSFSN